MTPEQFLGNAKDILTALIPVLASVSALSGTGAYIAGKATSQPRLCSWGRGGWIGGVVGFAAMGILGVVQNVGQRLGGG